MSEQKFGGEIKPAGHLDARVIRASRVYEASTDFDALVEKLSRAIDAGTKAGMLTQAELDVGIAKDLLASLYSLKGATETLTESSRRLEGLTQRLLWPAWVLVGLTVVLAILTAVLVYDVVRRLLLGN